MRSKKNLVCCGLGILLLWTATVPAGVAAAGPDATMETLNRIEVLDLNTAAVIALAGNPSLAAARARVMQAAEVVRQAQAPYWPRLDTSASAARVDLSDRSLEERFGFIPGFTTDGIDNPENYYNVDLTASWLIFNGFARRFALAAARYGEKAFSAAHFEAQRLLLSAVTFAYLQAQLAQENIAIAKADEAFNQRLLEEARLRYNVGTGALSDVLNFQIRGNSAKSRLIQEERTFQNNLISLAALMGVPKAGFPDRLRLAELAPTHPQELTEPQPAELVQTALFLRPDLQQSEWFVNQAQAGVQRAYAGYYPSISFSATYEGERRNDIGFEGGDFGSTVGIGLNWNLFAGGLTRAQVGEAKARLIELERVRDNTAIDVASEVKQVAIQIGAAQQQLLLQETNTGLVQQQRDLVEKEYKAGVGSLVRLNEAQRDLTVSLAQLALARVALRLAWYDLQTATGQIRDTFKQPGSTTSD
ncbi:MAG: TolC family protein [Desulfobacteraceae bacterium]|nr:MAG: TolC family protein [Desulfobacteraceae bacterium]